MEVIVLIHAYYSYYSDSNTSGTPFPALTIDLLPSLNSHIAFPSRAISKFYILASKFFFGARQILNKKFT